MYILSQRSPVVHQVEHFHDELLDLADEMIRSGIVKYIDPKDKDRAWVTLAATRCIWGCVKNIT